VQVVVSEGTATRIVELRAMGLSYRRIAAYLDRKKVPPPKAASWSAMTVRNIHLWMQKSITQASTHVK
jgi:hypothetical protein